MRPMSDLPLPPAFLAKLCERDQLPAAVRWLSELLPLTHAVALVRPLFMDRWPTDTPLHLGVLVAYAVGAFWIALALTRKRFRS